MCTCACVCTHFLPLSMRDGKRELAERPAALSRLCNFNQNMDNVIVCDRLLAKFWYLVVWCCAFTIATI